MPLTVIHASAGSGKTYQLALGFLKLLLKAELSGQPLDPSAILATTFTRVAAAEILDRVIQLLANAVLSESERAMLSENIGEPVTLAACGRVLTQLASRLDRLTISTMDAFFGLIAKAFAAELGLAPGWQMAVDEIASDIQRATLYSLMAQSGEGDLVDAIAVFRRQQVGSSVQSSLDLLSAAFQKIPPSEIISDTFQNPSLRFWATEETAEVLQIINDRQSWVGKTKAGGIPKIWDKALDELLLLLTPGHRVSRLFDSTLACRILEKKPFSGKEIPSLFLNAMARIIGIARAEIQRLHRARMEALNWLAAHYQKVRMETLFKQAAYTFGDVTNYVGRQSLRNDDLYYRLGTKFQHVLFDEFQDTSREQYEFFQPLLEEIGSNGGSSIIVVGDEKQAIYGWRGGDRELMHKPLQELAAKIGECPAPPLNHSYRSSPAVLNVINRVFGALQSAWNPDKPILEAAGREWGKGFVEHLPAPRVANLQGEVRLFEVAQEDSVEGEDKDGALISKTVELVQEHLQERRSVAVLLRKNKLLSQLMAAIRQACPDADVSGEGGNPLTDSRAVELILSLFTYLDHPGHTAARFHVLTSPARVVFGFPDSSEATSAAGPEEWNVLRAIRRALMDWGLTELLRSWIRNEAFLVSCNAYDRLRCEQLLEVAREYAQQPPARISQFVAHIRNRRVERRGGSSVRLMSIHSSKGLEFESVILMDIDSRMGSNGEPSIAEYQGEWQVVPNKDESPLLGMEELIEDEAQRDFAEELCVLYVGMTRARSFLDIVLRDGSKIPSAQLLRTSLSPNNEGVVECFGGISVRECDEANGRSKAPKLADPGIAQIPQPLSPSKLDYQRATYATPSTQEENGNIAVTSILAPANRIAMKRGELIHAWLSKLAWIEDGLPTTEEMLSSTGPLWEHLPRKEAEALAGQLLEQILTKGTSLNNVLSKRSFAPEECVELWRERRFAAISYTKKPELITGSFDRVVLWRNPSGTIDRAYIIDFKTDRFSSEAEREVLEERYRPQLDAYRCALSCAIPGLSPKNIQASLCFLGLFEIL